MSELTDYLQAHAAEYDDPEEPYIVPNKEDDD